MHRGGCSKLSFAIVLSLFLEKTAKNKTKTTTTGRLFCQGVTVSDHFFGCKFVNTQAACEEVLALTQSPRRLEVRWGGVEGGWG